MATGNIRKFRSMEHVLAHIGNTLINQRKKCQTKSGDCILYNPKNNTVCAIGAMLTAKGKAYYANKVILESDDHQAVRKILGDLSFGEVQYIHDSDGNKPRGWRKEFNKFAKEHGIDLVW